jgi:hypothetical protein
MNRLKLIALGAVIVMFTGATVLAQYRPDPSGHTPASGRGSYYGPSDQPYSGWGLPAWGSGADTSVSGEGSPSGQSGGSPSAQYQTRGRGVAAADGSVSGSASPSGQSGGSPSAQYRTSW